MTLSERIVSSALSQVGHRESAPNVTEYHDWYDSHGTYSYRGQAWCAIFVCRILDLAGARLPTIQGLEYGRYPGAAAVRYLRDWFGWQGWSVLPPLPGDIVFFTWSHVGIVVGVDPAGRYVLTVEGNTKRPGEDFSEWVWVQARPIEAVRCFCRIPENYFPAV